MAYDKKILGYLNISYNLDRNFISKCTMICETYPVENKDKIYLDFRKHISLFYAYGPSTLYILDA